MAEASHKSERDAIYRAVGEALDAWTTIELAIEPLFAVLAEANEIKGPVAMASIISFKARTQVCDALVSQSHAPASLRRKWRTLFNKLSRIYERRNELAHFSVIDWCDVDTGTVTTCLIPYFTHGNFSRLHYKQFDKVICAEDQNNAKQLMKQMPGFASMRLSSAQIHERTEEFEDLAREVRAIVSDFAEARRQAEVALEQIRSLQSQAASGHSPQES